MTFLPPDGSRMGSLELESVYEFYDGPVVFSCRNELGYKFFALAVDHDERGDMFVYVPVSQDRLIAIATGLVSMRDALAEPETSAVFAVQPDAPADSIVRELSPSALPEEWLPGPTQFLTQSLDTAFPFSADVLAELSIRQGRPLAALEFDISSAGRRTEFPLGQAGELMAQFQDFAAVVALRDAELDLVQLAAASFAVIVAPRVEPTLFPEASAAIRKVAALIAAAGNTDSDSLEQIGSLGMRGRAHLRDFLVACEGSRTGVTVFNAAPDGAVEEVRVTLPFVRSGLAALRARSDLPSEEFTVVGHLVAINHDTGTFGIVESEATERRKNPRGFRGRIDSELLPTLDTIETGRGPTYTMRIRRDRDVPEFPEAKPTSRDTLLSIQPVQLRAVRAASEPPRLRGAARMVTQRLELPQAETTDED